MSKPTLNSNERLNEWLTSWGDFSYLAWDCDHVGLSKHSVDVSALVWEVLTFRERAAFVARQPRIRDEHPFNGSFDD